MNCSLYSIFNQQCLVTKLHLVFTPWFPQIVFKQNQTVLIQVLGVAKDGYVFRIMIEHVALYLFDKGLLDNRWGCLDVGNKGGALGNSEQLRSWSIFNCAWRNSSKKGAEGFQGRASVDLFNTVVFIKTMVT